MTQFLLACPPPSDTFAAFAGRDLLIRSVQDEAQYREKSYEYNYLTHEQIAAFDEAMKACGGDADCKQAVSETYQDLSADNDEALRACQSWDCRAGHLAEIKKARTLAGEDPASSVSTRNAATDAPGRAPCMQLMAPACTRSCQKRPDA